MSRDAIKPAKKKAPARGLTAEEEDARRRQTEKSLAEDQPVSKQEVKPKKG